MSETITLLDPTSEREPVQRARRAPLPSLSECTVALLDIGKARGDVFIDQIARRLEGEGIRVERYAKPTNTKVAPTALAQRIAERCEVVVEALSD